MRTVDRIELLKDLVQQAVDRGATSVEQIHQSIAELPFETLERLGVLKPEQRGLRDRQRRSIGMVYDAIRSINRQVGELISDQFELLEDGQHIADVLKRKKAAGHAPAGDGEAQSPAGTSRGKSRAGG